MNVWRHFVTGPKQDWGSEAARPYRLRRALCDASACSAPEESPGRRNSCALKRPVPEPGKVTCRTHGAGSSCQRLTTVVVARGMRPNWFIAFPVPGDFVKALPPLPAGFRLFHPADVHLTLSFLGGCGQEAALRAFAVLNQRLRAAPLSSMPVSLGKVVPMGRPPIYSALSALLERGQDEVTSALAAHRDALAEAAAVRSDTRPPKPHVTLARPARRATPEHRRAGLTWAEQLDLSEVHASLDRLALYTWNQPRRDPYFCVVAETRLR